MCGCGCGCGRWRWLCGCGCCCGCGCGRWRWLCGCGCDCGCGFGFGCEYGSWQILSTLSMSTCYVSTLILCYQPWRVTDRTKD
jgi:hypothetical protein